MDTKDTTYMPTTGRPRGLEPGGVQDDPLERNNYNNISDRKNESNYIPQ